MISTRLAPNSFYPLKRLEIYMKFTEPSNPLNLSPAASLPRTFQAYNFSVHTKGGMIRFAISLLWVCHQVPIVYKISVTNFDPSVADWTPVCIVYSKRSYRQISIPQLHTRCCCQDGFCWWWFWASAVEVRRSLYQGLMKAALWRQVEEWGWEAGGINLEIRCGKPQHISQIAFIKVWKSWDSLVARSAAVYSTGLG